MSEQLVKSPLEWIDLVIKTLPYTGALALAVYGALRTNAMFYVVYRWHQLLGAAKGFNGKFAQRVWADHEDLQRFNLWFGLHLRTSKHMARLLSWLDRHELTIEQVCRARRYFDANELKFKIPSTRKRISVRALLLTGMMLLILASFVFTQTPYALFTVKKTGTTFWVQTSEAFNGTGEWLSWWESSAWEVDNEYCLFSDGVEPLKGQWDKDVICSLVLGTHNEKIKDVIEEQWMIGMSAGLVGFLWLLFLLFIIDRERNARALAAEIARVSSGTR